MLRSNAADNHISTEYALWQVETHLANGNPLQPCNLMNLIYSATKVICSTAMLQESMYLESNPSTLYTYIFIYMGIDAIIKI